MTWPRLWKSSAVRTDGRHVADVRLRPALPEDAECLALLQMKARRATTMPDPVHDLATLTARLAGRIAQDETWVAESGAEVVGYVRFTEEWLDDLYVDPATSGAGIGTALLDLVKSRLPDGFSLWVFEVNAGARAFYARRGLRELETTDGCANEEQCPDVRVVWPGRDPRRHLADLLADVDAQVKELEERRAALLRVLRQVDGSLDTHP